MQKLKTTILLFVGLLMMASACSAQDGFNRRFQYLYPVIEGSDTVGVGISKTETEVRITRIPGAGGGADGNGIYSGSDSLHQNTTVTLDSANIDFSGVGEWNFFVRHPQTTSGTSFASGENIFPFGLKGTQWYNYRGNNGFMVANGDWTTTPLSFLGTNATFMQLLGSDSVGVTAAIIENNGGINSQWTWESYANNPGSGISHHFDLYAGGNSPARLTLIANNDFDTARVAIQSGAETPWFGIMKGENYDHHYAFPFIDPNPSTGEVLLKFDTDYGGLDRIVGRFAQDISLSNTNQLLTENRSISSAGLYNLNIDAIKNINIKPDDSLKIGDGSGYGSAGQFLISTGNSATWQPMPVQFDEQLTNGSFTGNERVIHTFAMLNGDTIQMQFSDSLLFDYAGFSGLPGFLATYRKAGDTAVSFISATHNGITPGASLGVVGDNGYSKTIGVYSDYGIVDADLQISSQVTNFSGTIKADLVTSDYVYQLPNQGGTIGTRIFNYTPSSETDATYIQGTVTYDATYIYYKLTDIDIGGAHLWTRILRGIGGW